MAMHCVPCSVLFGDPAEYPTGPFPTSIAAADMDGDGHADVVTANTNGGRGTTVSVLLSDKGGRLLPKTDYTYDSGVVAIALADFDKDNDVDVATTVGTTVVVSKNVGDGTLGGRVTLQATAKSFGSFVFAGDVDGDGLADVVATGADMVVDSFRNLGGFGFAPAVSTVLPFVPGAVALADLDNNGKADLVLLDFATTMYVYLSDGSGKWSQPTKYPVSINTFSVDVGDIDRDGFPDVVVSNENDGRIGFYRNSGGGKLVPKPAIFDSMGKHPHSLALADLNQDGWLDAVFSMAGALYVVNNDHGTFGSLVRHPTTGLADVIVAAPLDGDDRLDLVHNNSGASTVTVLLNRCK